MSAAPRRVGPPGAARQARSAVGPPWRGASPLDSMGPGGSPVARIFAWRYGRPACPRPRDAILVAVLRGALGDASLWVLLAAGTSGGARVLVAAIQAGRSGKGTGSFG